MPPYQNVHDISVPLSPGTPVWPGDDRLQCSIRSSIDAGDECNCTRLMLSAHLATHIDSPRHFLPGGPTLDAYGVERFVLPALVVDCGDTESIRREHLADVPVSRGEALLLKTTNSARGLCEQRQFCREYVSVTPDAADWCVEREIGLLGTDYLSVEAFDSPGHPVHKRLLAADVLLLEGLNLRNVESGRYTLIALPLNLLGVEASPVRAVLLR